MRSRIFPLVSMLALLAIIFFALAVDQAVAGDGKTDGQYRKVHGVDEGGGDPDNPVPCDGDEGDSVVGETVVFPICVGDEEDADRSRIGAILFVIRTTARCFVAHSLP